ncbi:hypothetical protein J7E93_23900 [Streptomyces sp. ISL-36]|uniref:hypothetical protein n=1 Tax=Streptomyces sp. ISL-36 TaxID=2819182 RepID=UPI001BEB3477|nr:hypothetical protein [Streptomyces sp. ISL-36]MBT2443090.1 hypothetical protein [Streptomyces sp. ISL-36]
MASAQRLHARRVLVLVPTLDLLAQMSAAWRAGGRAIAAAVVIERDCTPAQYKELEQRIIQRTHEL